MKKILLPLLALASLSLSACAGPVTAGPQVSSTAIAEEAARQNALVYERFIEDQDKLFKLAFPIQRYNAEFCAPRVTPITGMTGWNIHTVARDFRQTAAQVFNVGERLAVQSVAPGSPAAKAGIMSGDIITSINGQDIPAGERAMKTAVNLMKGAGMNPSQLTLERDGKVRQATIQPVSGCDYPVLLDYKSAEVNAYADGEKIVVTKGMLRFAENQDELALVVAHEMGHSAMEHVSKLKQNAVAGSLGGLLIDSLFAAGGVSTGGNFMNMGAQIGVAQHSVGFEQEADYVGMYFMERAGYNSTGVANFWRRMAAEGQSSINQRTSHPTSPERFLAIEQAHHEIANKRAKGQALVPNMAKN